MILLLTMLPVYLLGNLHCLGMCGPLVMMIGRNRFRYYYFFGRLVSYFLTGAIAGGLGAVLNVFLRAYQIPAAASLLFGGAILLMGLGNFFRWNPPRLMGKLGGNISSSLSLLLLKDHPFSTFLFGFFTVLLPCGQTLIVFSASALSGDVWVGAFNGAAFALLSSPSLWFAMHLHGWMAKIKKNYDVWMGVAAIFVGTVSIARGLAELEIIEHLSYPLSDQVHLVLF